MKKILFLIFLSLTFMFWSMQAALASTIPVENVFSDIESDYKYYDELQALYDRGMIFPDAEGRFNPYSLLERDEFVGISMEVACERCIQPHTEYKFIEKYWEKDIYFDVSSESNYFYCIAEADEQDIVKWYDAGFTCENNVSKTGERPFCPQNTITLEEAIAVLLRNSWVFTIGDNKAVMENILTGNITNNISEDVSPTNPDGSPYTFYGYLQKALEFELTEFDTNGNEKIYKMLELTDGKIRPKKWITKQEFILLAYIVFKSNSCAEITWQAIALDLNILPASCTEDDDKCNPRGVLIGENIYDFNSEVRGYCEWGIDNPEGYIWRFHNTTTGDKFFKYWPYIDNLNFTPAGNWTAYLRVLDVCGNTWEIHNTFIIESDNDDISIWIESETNASISTLTWVVTGWTGPYVYEWDFWDGDTWTWEVVQHTYDPWVYEVTLTVTDDDGNTEDINRLIVIEWWDDISIWIDSEVENDIATLTWVVTGWTGPYVYEWDFWDGDTWTWEVVQYTYDPWVYEVTLTVTDDDGSTQETTTTIIINDETGRDDNIIVDIEVDPLIWFEDLLVWIEGIVVGWAGPYVYEWDFGDGGDGIGANIDHIYDTPWTYEILLIVTDAGGNTGEATVLIQVLPADSCDKDSDWDGIVDCEDKCTSVSWTSTNLWCPILDDEDTPEITLGAHLDDTCIYNKDSATIFWNAVCNSCPCSNQLDFLADIRKCDIIFPAITSPDASSIYSKWRSLQIR